MTPPHRVAMPETMMVRTASACRDLFFAGAVLAALLALSPPAAAGDAALDARLNAFDASAAEVEFSQRLARMSWTSHGHGEDPLAPADPFGELSSPPPEEDRETVVIPLPSALYVFPLGALVAGWCSRRWRR